MAVAFKDPGPAVKAAWLAENPGDEGRFKAAFTEEQDPAIKDRNVPGAPKATAIPPPPPVPPPPSAAIAAPAPAAGGGADNPSMVALNKVADPVSSAPAAAGATASLSGLDMLSSGMSTPSNVDQSMMGILRALGRRSPPSNALVLGPRSY